MIAVGDVNQLRRGGDIGNNQQKRIYALIGTVVSTLAEYFQKNSRWYRHMLHIAILKGL